MVQDDIIFFFLPLSRAAGRITKVFVNKLPGEESFSKAHKRSCQCRNWDSITFLTSALLLLEGARLPCPVVVDASRSAKRFGVSFFLPGVTSPKSMVNASGSNLTVSVQSWSSSTTCRVGVACWAATLLSNKPVELSESLLKSSKGDDEAGAVGRFSTAMHDPVSGIQWPGIERPRPLVWAHKYIYI